MIDLDLDDSLDREDDDDLLALDVPQVKRLEPLWPSPAAMLRHCAAFERDVAKGVEEVYYDGATPTLALSTYVELFDDWWKRYQTKKNPALLELAFMCAVKNMAGESWAKVHCSVLGRDLRAEVIDCTDTAVRVAIDLPFEAHGTKGNLEWSTHWRAMWFNRKTRKPLNPLEPFRLL